MYVIEAVRGKEEEGKGKGFGVLAVEFYPCFLTLKLFLSHNIMSVVWFDILLFLRKD